MTKQDLLTIRINVVLAIISIEPDEKKRQEWQKRLDELQAELEQNKKGE